MEKKIEQLLKEFDNIPEIYRDHDDDYDEKVTYYHENSMENGFGLEIHIHELVMDIYLAFGYVDISSDDIKTQSPFVIDDLEMNERELWREKLFASHLKKDASYFVSEWGDSGMCPGYTSYIGYLQIPCDVEVVVRFMDICKKFMTKVDTIKDSALLRKIAAEYAKSIGLKDFPLELESSRIEATKSKTPVNEETILNYPYFGERYAFFKLSDIDSETISVSATDANIFKTLVDNYEYVKDVTYFLVGSKLIGLSRHFIWISSYTKGHFANYAPTMEQTGIMNKMQSFLPYASETLRSLYYKEYKNKIAYGKGIRIFTEGPTDWKHLKYHWTYLKNDKKWKWYQLDIDFHEYESTNSSQEAEFKIDMGGDALCDMCQATSQMENEDIRIFIADRDKENVIKKLMDKETPFKYWGNNVYSIVLPIPPHRTQTPKICIEHYYSDNEIKLEFDCRDGIKRRLYMGNEFDKYGRAVEINRFCINREACGVDSIRIINGSEKERVISLTDNSANINYALSKMQYVDSICSEDIELESGTIEAFASLFELILAIKTHNNELTASK